MSIHQDLAWGSSHDSSESINISRGVRKEGESHRVRREERSLSLGNWRKGANCS